jgi:radical SAM protein with 4Fe4S-binding SPASM domain
VMLMSLLRRLAKPPAPPPPGLTLHEFRGQGADVVRLHLRIETTGEGLLFCDVTDVVHLNETAAAIAHDVLHGVARDRTLGTLRARFAVSRAAAAADYDRIAHVVTTLATPVAGCRTCLAELPQTPVFSARANAPYKADLALTYACNNDCPHCYNEPDRFDLPPMDRASWGQALDVLARVGVPHVILTGGEPTMHPDVLAIIEDATARGLVVGMNSNGRRFATGDFAERSKAAGLDHLQVTVESHRAEVHDAMVGSRAWEQTTRGVRRAREAGLLTLTNTTLTRANVRELDALLDFLAFDLKLSTFAMNAMIHSGGGAANPDTLHPDELAAILVRVREGARERGLRFLWYTPTEYCRLNPVELEIGAKRCNAGEYSLCVEPDGAVLPCQSYYTSAGNILSDPWESIWNGELFRSFREREEDPKSSWLPEKCHECPDLPLCGGGCRIEHESAARGASSGGCASGGCGGCPSASGASPAAGFVAIDSLLPERKRGTQRSTGHAAEVRS